MENAQLSKLKERIPFDEDKFSNKTTYQKILTNLLEDAKYIALSTLYPFLESYEGLMLPSKYFNWQIRAALDIYKWQGNSGIKSYSEANLSWTRASDGDISQSLLDELEPPRVGTPKRKEVSDDNQ